MEAKKKATGKEYTSRKEIPYLGQKLEEKGSKKKVQKFSTKILQVQSEVKKKYWNVYPKGWGLRIPSIPPTQHTSTTPPVPLSILLNPDSTYSRLHALGTYCGWRKATPSWWVLLCTSGPEVIMTGVV